MGNYMFTEDGFKDYTYWQTEDRKIAMMDATCAPTNIRYPQDVSLLNEAREKLKTILYRFHKAYGLPLP